MTRQSGTAALLYANGAPGICSHYHADYFAAFVIGLNGHNLHSRHCRFRNEATRKSMSTRTLAVRYLREG